MRYVSGLVTALLLSLGTPVAFAAVADLSVNDIQLVGSQRVGRTLYEYTFTATLANTGGPLDNVVATVTSSSSATQVVEDTVVFGSVSAGDSSSADTFKVRHNRRYQFNQANLVWSFTADEPAGNNAPSADAGPDQTVNEGDSVTLDGSGSFDPEEDPLTYAWTLAVPAGSAAILSNNQAESPTFIADIPGVYVATLIVNDGTVNSASDSVTITADAVFVNTPPVANAGADQQVNVGSTVNLTALGSTDVDLDPLTYLWGLTVPAGSSAALSDNTSATPSFTADVVGSYLATLVVNDATDDSAPDSATVTAIFVGANAPTITSSANTAGSVSEPYAYNVTATDPDTGDTLTYSLQLAPAGMAINASSGLITWTPSVTGPADVDVIVTDSTGLTDRQIYLILVNNGDGDQPPTLDPIADQSTVVNQTIMVTAVGNDPEGESLRYSVISSPSGLGINISTGELFWTPDSGQTGSFNATVTVMDPGGQTAQESFAISVLSGTPNNPPVIAQVNDQTINALGTIQLTFSATDVDANDILSFSLTGQPSGMQFDAATATLFWIPGSDQTGNVNLTASVRDSANVTDSTSFIITVAEPPFAPVAVDDQYTIDRNAQLQIPADGVLTNDTDRNNDVLSANDTSAPSLGTLDSFPGNGGFDYTPPATPAITIGLREQCRSPVSGSSGIRQMPIIGDIDADGVPELVNVGPLFTGTRIFVMDGNCNVESSVVVPRSVIGSIAQSAQAPLVNLDSDPQLELVAVRVGPPQGGINRARLVALNQDGSFVWTNLPDGASEAISLPVPNVSLNYYAGQGPIIADIDADGSPEIIMSLYFNDGGLRSGVVVYNADGTIKAEIAGVRQNGDSDSKPPYVVDLDMDGKLEIINHTNVYRWDEDTQSLVLDFNLQSTSAVSAFESHLTIGIANFDNDPFPELLGRDKENIYLFEHNGGPPTWTVPLANSSNSEIVIAELDGDPQPEFAFFSGLGTGSNATWLTAFDTDGSLLWTHQNTVYDSSAVIQNVGITAFDFDRDGIDELTLVLPTLDAPGDQLFIFRGSDGVELAAIEALANSISYSVLKDQSPTVADIDGDGEAEIIFVDANTFSDDAFMIVEGLQGNGFAPARPIRNQRIYQPTHVNPDGSIPISPKPHWLIPGMNKWNAAPVLPFEDPGATDSFNYVANDGTANSNVASVTMAITNVNAPTIVSNPPLGASPDFAYQYGLLATDGDFGDVLAWTLVDAPTGMTVSSLGVVDWTPTTGDLGIVRVHVVVTDSQGNSDQQSFEISVVPPTTVPNIVGGTQAAAVTAIEGAGLAIGSINQGFSFTVPVGEVISQSISGGSVSAAGAFVNLVISLGPQPIYVPDVTDLSQAAAQTLLESNGLNLGTVTLANSDSVPVGVVISQGTAASSQVVFEDAVDVSVSSGPALLATLGQAMVAPGGSVPASVTVFDNTGTPLVPQPLVNISLIADAGASGTPPSVSASVVNTSADTTGSFSYEVDAGAFGSASIPFIVRDGLNPGDYYEPIAQFAETLDDTSTTYSQLLAALEANDLAAIQVLGQQLRALRDSIDLDLLSRRTPFAPVSGFIPTAQQAAASGFPAGFGELQNGSFFFTTLESAINENISFLKNLNPAVGRDDNVRARALNNSLRTSVDSFNSSIGTYSVGAQVFFHADSFALLAKETPKLVHADLEAMIGVLTDNGLLAIQIDETDGELFAQLTPADFYNKTNNAFFSLGGIMTASSIRMTIVKSLYLPHITRLVSAAIILADAQALLADQEVGALAGIITGASLSFHVFNAPNSVIEVPGLSRDSRSFRVEIIGPDKYQAALDAIVNLTKPTSVEDVKELAQTIEDVAKSSDDGQQFVQVHDRIRGCILDSSPECIELVVGFGFPVVHSSGGFPAPSIVIVHDDTQSKIYAGVFAFFPN